MSGPFVVALLVVVLFFLWRSESLKKAFESSGITQIGERTARKFPSVVLFVVAGVIAVILAYVFNPHMRDVDGWVRGHWIALLILWGFCIGLIELHEKKRREEDEKEEKKKKELARMLRRACTTIALLLLIGIPVVSGMANYFSPYGCTSGHPCVLSPDDRGTSSAIDVPKGSTVCFDPWMWAHLNELRLTVSYRGGKETSFPCSVEAVYQGRCVAIYDRFWFEPGHRMELPNYWFVPSGSSQC